MKRGVLWMVATAAAAQPVSVGIRAGVPLTDAFRAARGGSLSYATDSKRYVIGPTLDLHLPFRTSVTFELLYRRLGYTSTTISAAPIETTTTANLFEFPVMLKHRFNEGMARPYLAAGAAFNKLSGVKQLVGGVLRGRPPELDKESTAGLVFAGGVELGALALRVSPELRYTYRNSAHFRDAVSGLLESNKNQFEFLIGLTF